MSLTEEELPQDCSSPASDKLPLSASMTNIRPRFSAPRNGPVFLRVRVYRIWSGRAAGALLFVEAAEQAGLRKAEISHREHMPVGWSAGRSGRSGVRVRSPHRSWIGQRTPAHLLPHQVRGGYAVLVFLASGIFSGRHRINHICCAGDNGPLPPS